MGAGPHTEPPYSICAPSKLHRIHPRIVLSVGSGEVKGSNYLRGSWARCKGQCNPRINCPSIDLLNIDY